jgi:GAF domain-containing protein
MIRRFQDWLRPTSPDPDTAHRQYLLNIVLLGLAGPGFAFGVIMLVLWLLNLSPPAGVIAGLGVQPFYLLSYWLGRRGRVKLAGYIPASVVFLAMAGSFLQVGVGHISTVGIAMVVVTAGILIGVEAATIFVVLGMVVYLLSGWAQQFGLITAAFPPSETVIIDAIGLGLGLAVLVIFNWISGREMQRALRIERDLTARLQVQSRELEQMVQQRTMSLQRKAAQLETTAAIAKLASEMADPQELMNRAIELTHSRFGYYHVSIFMIDETGNWADLIASTGEVGHALIEKHFRLAVGSVSMIGWATANRSLRMAQDVIEDPFYFKLPALPDTRSELAIPLIVGNRLLGALDIQSTEGDAFGEDDIQAMEAIADELAVAIDSARLLRQTQQQLERFESSYRDLARPSWRRIARSIEGSAFQAGIFSPIIEGEEQRGFDTIDRAAQRREAIVSDDESEMAVPVQMRGEVVATIGARKTGENERWSSEDVALLQAISRQIALALESARQYTEEHRRLAELEVVNRISQAVSQHLRLESLYRVVHAQVHQVLDETDLYFALYDRDANLLRFPYVSENKSVVEVPPVAYGDDLTSLIIRTRQPLLIQSDVERRARALGARLEGRIPRSWLGVPLLIGDDILGALVVLDYDREMRYSEDDAALLTTLASQVATALQNAQLMEQVQRTARRERLIHEITSKVRRAPDFRTILETTARELSRSLRAARASIKLGAEAPGTGSAEDLPQNQIRDEKDGSSPQESSE